MCAADFSEIERTGAESRYQGLREDLLYEWYAERAIMADRDLAVEEFLRPADMLRASTRRLSRGPSHSTSKVFAALGRK